MQRKHFLMSLAAAAAATPEIVATQTVRAEKSMHPRIAAAIKELREAVAYMRAAPHDFGGHKADAIRDSEAAIRQLELALAYRAEKDRK
jgi:hypothetical protein